MVTIITGERNSGKTAFFEYWYNEVRRGGGFYTKKNYENNSFRGYDLVLLPTRETVPFVTVWQPQHAYAGGPILTDKLVVDMSVFPWVEEKLEPVLASPDEPVWIDEIGMRELSGNGFDPLVRKLLAVCSDVRLVVKKSLLQKVVGRYGIGRFSLVYV